MITIALQHTNCLNKGLVQGSIRRNGLVQGRIRTMGLVQGRTRPKGLAQGRKGRTHDLGLAGLLEVEAELVPDPGVGLGTLGAGVEEPLLPQLSRVQLANPRHSEA